MSADGPGGRREFLLFVYDASMSGLADEGKLSGARLLGPASTEAAFDLVEMGTQVALVAGGATSVRGEVHVLDAALLATLDVQKGHPVLYRRARIRLEDGREAEAYMLSAEQARGRRRIRSGDFRSHVAPAAPERRGGAWSRWARGRRSPGSR